MDPETLSRIQFALTISFHFIYPPISMGLGMLDGGDGLPASAYERPDLAPGVVLLGQDLRPGVRHGYRHRHRARVRVRHELGGVLRFVGNIFGSLLAAEGIFAFFLEGGFLGLMLFGGTRLGPRMWLLATSLVVFGAHFSALWIIMANSWMQTPQGYTLQTTQWGQQAFMTEFSSVVFTPSFIPRLLHTWVASWMVGASLVMSVSAWYLLKHRHVEFAKKSLSLALWWFAILSRAADDGLRRPDGD